MLLDVLLVVLKVFNVKIFCFLWFLLCEGRVIWLFIIWRRMFGLIFLIMSKWLRLGIILIIVDIWRIIEFLSGVDCFF